MGGLWAGKIAAAGYPTTIIDVSTELIDAVRTDGLVVEEGTVSLTSRPQATTDARSLDAAVDVIFVFVKGPHTPSAAGLLPPLIGPDTTVVTLQNGWGNADVLAERVPADQLVVGVTYEGSMILSPGRVRHNGYGMTYLGPFVDGAGLRRAQAVDGVMAAAGFECLVTPAVKTEIWRKLVHNASCLAVSALTGLRTAELVDPGPVRELVDALAREAVAVARKVGYDIDADERIETIHRVLGAAGLGIPSMLADVRARRATEISTINGAVVRAAHTAGMAAPLNESMFALVSGLERSWSS